LEPDDGPTLVMSGSGWCEHIVVLGISQIITDGEHIPSHLTRLDARERGNRARQIQGANLPTARDRHDFGRGRGEGRILGDLTTASKLARRMRGKRGSGANGGVDHSGGGRGVIGFTLRGDQEGIEGIILMGLRKRIALVENLCLRGKVGRVGRRTLMKSRMVSPIVVLDHDGLRVAPDGGTG
jgi:hypothetical protein